MSADPWGFYDWLGEAAGSTQPCDGLLIGQVWTLCLAGEAAGLAMTPMAYSRTLEFPGTLAGSALNKLAAGIKSWQPFEAAVAMSAINAARPFHAENFDDVSDLPNRAGNLAVFDYFLPRIRGARIVVVGRYPGLEAYESEYDLQVIERQPTQEAYPDPAAEYLIPEADWVFLTASSITNKTFPRLAELSRHAVTVLMGPTTPWLADLSEWGIDFLAGVVVNDVELLAQIVAEGGGKRIFDAALSYRLADIGQARMQQVKAEIARLAAERDALKWQMDDWYREHKGRFPELKQLEQIQHNLSGLDTLYKQMWDARHG